MKIQSEHYFELPGDVHIGVTSTSDLPCAEREQLLLGAYLPGLCILEKAPIQLDMVIHHEESSERSLVQQEDCVVVRDTWQRTFSPDLPHLLYSVARNLWLQRNIYPSHAACAGEDSFILLPGHSGVGKTSAALELVAGHGQRLFSGNTTLLSFDEEGGMRAIAGTRTVTLRTDDFRKRKLEAVRHITYGERTAFQLPDEEYALRPAVAIGKIGLIRLNSAAHYWERLSVLSALHQVYPHGFDLMHADAIMADGKGLFRGETPAGAKQNLRAYLSEGLGHIATFAGVGGRAFIARQLMMS